MTVHARVAMRSTRARSSWVAGIAYVPLAPDLRREHPGKGLLVVRFKRSREERVYLVPSWLPGLLAAPQNSVGALLNKFALHGKAPSAAAEE